MQCTSSLLLFLATALTPLVLAHGKVASIAGDAGGNGTALGIKGAVVPGQGQLSKIESDTTVFWSKDMATDNDIGFTQGAGKNNQLDLNASMALSGAQLPQVSRAGGSVAGMWHTVVRDGGGPLKILVDGSATAKWSQAVEATVTTQIPGTNGQFPLNTTAETTTGYGSATRRALEWLGLVPRDTNDDTVDITSKFAFNMPAGMTCNGTIGDQQNLCLVKVSNLNQNGPFGGCFAVQMVNPGSSTAKPAKRATLTERREGLGA